MPYYLRIRVPLDARSEFASLAVTTETEANSASPGTRPRIPDEEVMIHRQGTMPDRYAFAARHKEVNIPQLEPQCHHIRLHVGYVGTSISRVHGT